MGRKDRERAQAEYAKLAELNSLYASALHCALHEPPDAVELAPSVLGGPYRLVLYRGDSAHGGIVVMTSCAVGGSVRCNTDVGYLDNMVKAYLSSKLTGDSVGIRGALDRLVVRRQLRINKKALDAQATREDSERSRAALEKHCKENPTLVNGRPCPYTGTP